MYGGDFRREGGNSFAPVRVGEEIDVRIEAVGEKGDGIARKKGFVLFVPNTNEGDEVRIKITKVLRKVGFAEVVGKAQGPVEEDTPPPAKEERAPAPMPEPEPAQEDSEDFGDDSAEPEMDAPPAPDMPEEPEEDFDEDKDV
jgi:predicted RNA-binding protein with TRAM domain